MCICVCIVEPVFHSGPRWEISFLYFKFNEINKDQYDINDQSMQFSATQIYTAQALFCSLRGMWYGQQFMFFVCPTAMKSLSRMFCNTNCKSMIFGMPLALSPAGKRTVRSATSGRFQFARSLIYHQGSCAT